VVVVAALFEFLCWSSQYVLVIIYLLFHAVSCFAIPEENTKEETNNTALEYR
jgi:hypothetical protein